MLLPRCAIQVIDSGKERVDGFREQCAERKGRGARETSCAVGVRVGRTGGAAVKQGGMGGIARLRTRGRRAAWGVFRAEREERGADAGEAASDSLGERGAEEDEAERDGAGRGAVAAQGARGRSRRRRERRRRRGRRRRRRRRRGRRCTSALDDAARRRLAQGAVERV